MRETKVEKNARVHLIHQNNSLDMSVCVCDTPAQSWCCASTDNSPSDPNLYPLKPPLSSPPSLLGILVTRVYVYFLDISLPPYLPLSFLHINVTLSLSFIYMNHTYRLSHSLLILCNLESSLSLLFLSFSNSISLYKRWGTIYSIQYTHTQPLNSEPQRVQSKRIFFYQFLVTTHTKNVLYFLYWF